MTARHLLAHHPALAGTSNALASLALVLTLGLLAYAPLGVQAVQLGIAASFATVIAAGVAYALRSQVAVPTGGPSSATALILAGLVAQLVQDPALQVSDPAGLVALAAVVASSVVLMGVLQMLLGLLGLGRLARFVPQPVLAGFMNGVALLILAAQLPPLLGLPAVLGDAAVWSQVQPATLLLGLATAGVLWLVQWKAPRLPSTLIALAAGLLLHAALSVTMPGTSTGPAVGPLPQGWVQPDVLLALAGPQAFELLQRHAGAVCLTAAVLAVIGSLESLLTGVVIDQLTHTRHDGRQELLALGLANLVGGLFGALPMVLLRTRAVPLIDAGATGRGPVLVAAGAFALLFAFGGPLIAQLPKTVLAGIMVTIAVALVDRWTHQLLRQFRAGERSSEVWLSLVVVAVVCAVTVRWGFVAGVGAGVLLSMVVFIRSMNRSLLRLRCSAADQPSRRVYGAAQEALLAQQRQRVTLLELEGALFFGSAERLAAEARKLPPDGTALVLDLRRINTIDETGAVLLQDLSRQLARRGVQVLLAGVSPHNAHGQRLRAFGCFRESPRDDWFGDADSAVEAAEQCLLAEAGMTVAQTAVPLAATALLRGLAPDQLARVMDTMPAQNLAAGAYLFWQGDPGDRVYVLTQGSISIVGSHTGQRQRYISFSPGVMLGEMAMLDGGRRSADAVADTDAVVHALTRTQFDALCDLDPALGGLLLRNIALHLSERLRAAA